jgi:hypothetical protein
VLVGPHVGAACLIVDDRARDRRPGAHAENGRSGVAQLMLREVLLPPGARRSFAPDPAVFSGLLGIQDVGNLVPAHHQLFTVPDEPHSVWQWFEAHIPRGFVSEGGSSGTTQGVQLFGVHDELRERPLNISLAELVIRVTGDGSGGAVVRVDAPVAWTEPRADEEFVTGADRVMIVSTVHAYERVPRLGRRVVVTDAAVIQPIVRAFNQARLVAAPGRFGSGFECGLIGLHDVVYRVAFAESAAATPNIVATLACARMRVSVNGHDAPTLENLPNETWNQLRHVLGLADLPLG